jgi:hypothetical protein
MDVLRLTLGLRSEKTAISFLRYGTTAASMYITKPISFFHVRYLILSLETPIIVWLRIHFLDTIILKLACRNLRRRK